jgi:hypothetical protein
MSEPLGAGPHTKGASLRSDFKFLKHRLGEAEFEKVLASLAPADRAVLSNVLPHHWVSIPAMGALTKAAAPAAGMSELQLAFALGAHNADEHLHSVYRLFLRLGPADMLFKSTASLWSNYYDAGKIRISVDEPGHKILQITEFGYKNSAWCERIFGYIDKGFTLSGNRLKKYEHPRCTGRGDAVCDLELFY